MLNGHRERIHAFPTQELIDHLDSQLLLAEENWKSAQNDLRGGGHNWTTVNQEKEKADTAYPNHIEGLVFHRKWMEQM